jgi:hypothetical protein
VENISINKLIDFRRNPAKTKKSFAESLNAIKIKEPQDGKGNYWISSISALTNSFKLEDSKPIIDKIGILKEKREESEYERTKTMYQRNIDILKNYTDFNLKKWLPFKKLTFLKKSKSSTILKIKGFPIQVNPSLVFAFQKNGEDEIGSIWFIPKIKGLSQEELGLYSEVMYRYLKNNYSKKNDISSRYCIAFDVVNKLEVNYSQLENMELPFILNSTLDDLRKLL